MARKRYPSDDPKYRREKSKKSGAPPSPQTRRKPRLSPSAPAAPALQSTTPTDFGAFTRRRGAVQAKAEAVPRLEDLAAEEAPELAAVSGGDCPRCHREHGDDDRHCQFCGAALRRACTKCERPLRDDQAFCPTCGIAAPAVLELVPPPSETGGQQGDAGAQLVALPTPAAEWEADDLFWVGAGVDMVLTRMDGDLLEDKERERINRRSAAVANKHFRIGGKWKEEIQLGMAIAGAIFPTAYLYFVVAPREKRERESAPPLKAVEK